MGLTRPSRQFGDALVPHGDLVDVVREPGDREGAAGHAAPHGGRRFTILAHEPDGSIRRIAEMRTPNRAQRRALEAIYSTCAHPDCQIPITQCKAHHIIWYSKRGPTLLDNLVPLCEQHHHLVHEGGWRITMTPDRTITWTTPDGTIWRTHHSPNRHAPPTTRAG